MLNSFFRLQKKKKQTRKKQTKNEMGHAQFQTQI